MHWEITYCHVAEIAVSSRHQKQGIGERLLRAVEDWGRRQGNITPQTRAPALSISGAWVLRSPHDCDQASLG
jgi:GNAT superfamily N-acetyltransferase